MWKDRPLDSLVHEAARLAVAADLALVNGSAPRFPFRPLLHGVEKELEARIGRSEMRRLIRVAVEDFQKQTAENQSREREQRRIEDFGGAERLASKWIAAWQSRHIHQLLSLFPDDATYTNKTFGPCALDRTKFSSLFAALLHDRAGGIEPRGIEVDNGKTIVHWSRSCGLVLGGPAITRLLHGQSITFEGTSTLETSLGYVKNCTDCWSGYRTALQSALLGGSAPRSGPAPAIVVGDGFVRIGGVTLPRRRDEDSS
jgi:hypothetical protein